MQENETLRAFTIEQFGKRWNLKRNAIYNLIAKGELGSIKAGKRRLITVEQEEAFRERMEQKSA